MSVHRRSTAAAEEQRADKGFTLIEVMIAVVLLTVITGAIAAAMITALNVASSTTAQVADSTDAGVISAYLLRDAQSAGATDPATGLRSTTFGRLGVTTDTTAATLTGCAQPAAFVARFSWIDPIERTSPVVVYYALDSTKGQLTRRICRSQTTVDLVVGNHLTSAVATCDTTCALSPASVSLALTGSGARAPFAYTLRASIRSDAQAPPTGGNSSPVPLLALGGGAAVACPNLTLSGTGPIKVIGNAFVDSSCGATPIAGAQGVLRPTGTTASIAGINDPFSGRTPPPDTCASGSSTVTGQGTDTLTQYAANVSIVADTVFQPGRYVFCNGLALTAGKITGTDVLLYVKAGTITVGAAATVDMAGRASGADTNLLIWVAGPDQTIQVDAGTRVSSLRGVIYAPTSTLQLSSTNAANVGGVVVENMTITGAGQARLGLPLPLTAIAPATIPSGEVGVVSASTAFSAAGGVAPYGNWSAAGLPAGMSIDATGTLSGTPTASGTFNVTVAVFDATAQATSMDYTLSIRPRPTVTGPAPANGQIGVAYAPTTQTASGGTTPYAWSATGLPAGVSIGAATGTIAGAPTESGTFTVIVTVTDAVGATATRSSTVTINAVPSISGPAVLPVGQLGAPYRPTTVTAAGGTAPYRWSATGLPSGLSIDASTGVLAGAPTIAGTFTAVVTVTDAVGATATATFTITINATPSIAGPATLPNGQVAIAYASTTVTVNDGTAPFSWMATGLPAGLTINASTGTVAGTPTASGTFTIAVSATDAVGATATKGYTIAINAAPTVSAPAALPAGQINVAYASTNVTGSGGTTPYAWTATGLPAGLSITIGGAVSGTATASGAFTVVATLTDAVGATATKSYTLTIKVAPSVAAPATLPAGQVNVAFTATTVTGSGGTTPYLWSATGMPSGISIAASSGVVSGAPTLSGTFTAVVTVTDAVGATATKSYTVTIKAAPTVTGPDLPSGQVSIVYTATTEIGSGGTTAYVWSATGLPTGLTIVSSTGIVSGTPTVAGSYAVVVKLTDAVGATATANYAVTIRASPSVATPATLPTGQISQVYSSTTLTGSGGTTPYTWSATGMPPGVTIAASTGVISGTPTASGTFTAVLKVTDAVAGTGTKTYTVTVNAAPSVTAPAALPAGQINVAYVAPTVTGSGGTTPYTWSATAAPTGVTIDPSTGVISGTPTASGAFTVVVRVTDAVAATATRSYTLTVKAAPAVAGPATLPSGKNGVAYTSTTVTVSGGTTPYAWSATGLPGLSIASATGVISGTPNATGSFTVVVSVVDANAQSASRTYTLAIADPVPVAVANSYTLNEDTTLTVAAAGVLANDTDPRGLPLTAVLVSGVANGALTFNADGGFTYVPRPTFNGAASFTYKANDGSFDSAVVTVSLTVTAIDDAPVNSVPGPQQTPKNTNLVFSSTNRNLISISDIDAAASLVQVKLNATNGTVTLPVVTGLTFTVGDGTTDATMTFTGTIANVNLRLGGLVFAPTTDFNGEATLQIVTNDQGFTGTGGPLSDTDSVTVTVNARGIFTDNVDIGAPGVAGSSSYSASTYTVAGGGADISGTGDQFQYLYRAITGDGRLTARLASQTGTDTRARAGVMFRESTAAGSSHGTFDITSASGWEFLSRPGNGLTTNSLQGTGIAAPYWMRLTRVGNSITAEWSANGTAWTALAQGPQTVAMASTIDVGLAVNAHNNASLNTAVFTNVAITTPPTANPDSYSVNEDTTLTVAASGVLANDTDPENDALTAVLVSGATGLTLNANGSFTYLPPASFAGTASFTYKANDGAFDSGPITVTLVVNPANERPSFIKGANQSIVQAPAAQAVPGWATAINPGAGESAQLINFIVTNTSNATFSVQPAVDSTGALTYTPAAGATGVVTVSVSIHDNGGTANGGFDTSAVQTFTITLAADTTGPTGGSVDAAGLVGTGARYAPSLTLSLNLVKGTDPNGLATTGAQLKRATAALTWTGGADGACDTFGAYTLVTGGTDPATPTTDTVADQACYSYQYVVADTIGNSSTWTSPVIKVDTVAPGAPALVFSAFTNTAWSGSGGTVYYRSAATSGSFTTTATVVDPVAGIAAYGFPALGTTWTSTPGATGVNTYAWTGGPAAPGTAAVTATNNAGRTSTGTSFTVTADGTAPNVGTITYLDGSQSETSVSVSFTTGTDSASGVGTRLLQRQSAILTGVTCGTFGALATLANGTNPTSPFVDTVATGRCYRYGYVTSDNVGNVGAAATSANVVKVSSYTAAVSGTAGLLSFWRLGESTVSTDTFTGTAGVTLQARSGEIGATWTKQLPLSTADALITSAGRIRKNGSSAFAVYSASGVPTGADYAIEADVFVASSVVNDRIGILGRVDPAIANGTFYAASYSRASQTWVLAKVVNGVQTMLAQTASQALAVGTTYRLTLDMNGTTIRLLVNGAQQLSSIDAAITTAGRGGVVMGDGVNATALSDTTGMHLDNFSITPPLADSAGTNVGDYRNGPTLGTPGAIVGDASTAVQFSGVSDYATVARQISADFSIELWFKSTTGGIGTGAQWWQGAGLVDAQVSGPPLRGFGVSLRADGKVVAGVGKTDVSIISGSGYNDGGWHHVVFTREMASGALVLYVDGVAVGAATGSTAALTDPPAINFGRLQIGTNSFTGSLDDVAVYTTVLTSATVIAHHDLG